jgi:hypothetical protein
LSLCALLVANQAFASASILGFSVGEDDSELAAIYTEAVQQLAVLKNIASFSSTVVTDIGFIKGVYNTVSAAVQGNWSQLGQEFLNDILSSNTSIRTIYTNTSAIISNNVPANNGFQKLVSAGLSEAMTEVFGPYPTGNLGAQYAYVDMSLINLDTLANRAQDQARADRVSRRMQTALQNCESQGLTSCQVAHAHATIQVESDLTEVRDMIAAQMQAQAAATAIATSERKLRALEAQATSDSFGQALADSIGARQPLTFDQGNTL